jgi:hypothetical protein
MMSLQGAGGAPERNWGGSSDNVEGEGFEENERKEGSEVM